ncbi:hypothetical protein D9M69_612350 [compost metagenome]
MSVSPVICVTVAYEYVVAVMSISHSRVIAWPGSSEVPQRKPGEKAMGASWTSMSASSSNWSPVPLKLPRRYSTPSVCARVSDSLAS